MILQMGDFETTGTSLAGCFPRETTYGHLLEVFGIPQYSFGHGDKVQVQWIGKIKTGNKRTKIFTIYDYKSGVAPEENTDWHIGGADTFVSLSVIRYFNEVIEGQKEEKSEEKDDPVENKAHIKQHMTEEIERIETLLESLKNSCTYNDFERLKNMDDAFKIFKVNFHCI